VKRYHLTFAKCGSHWVRDLLFDAGLLESNKLEPVYGNFENVALAFSQPREGSVIAPLYDLSLPLWEKFSGKDDLGVLVIRDPRDIIVSMVFSMAYSHALSPAIEVSRSLLHALPEEKWMEAGMLFLSQQSASMESWFAELPQNVLRVCYRDLVADTESTFGRMLDFLKIQAAPQDVRRIVTGNSFEAQTGRKAGEEDQWSHLRKGRPGDWENHFTQAQAELFERTWPGWLCRMGYESHSEWPARLSGEKSKIGKTPNDNGTTVPPEWIIQKRAFEKRLLEQEKTVRKQQGYIGSLEGKRDDFLRRIKVLRAECERLGLELKKRPRRGWFGRK